MWNFDPIARCILIPLGDVNKVVVQCHPNIIYEALTHPEKEEAMISVCILFIPVKKLSANQISVN